MDAPRYQPRLILCVTGDADFPAAAQAVAEKHGLECDVRGHEPRMVESFKVSACRVRRSLTAADYKAIRAHQTVAYVLSDNYPAGRARQAAYEMICVGRQLLEAGGTAMKCDSSGIAHARGRWLDLAGQADSGRAQMDGTGDDAEAGAVEFWGALYEAFVRFPISDSVNMYGCGLHLLGLPDVIIRDDLLERVQEGGLNNRALWAATLAEVFALYLLTECPGDTLQTGHTFRMDDESPRFRLAHEPCTGYEEDEFFFNPYGRWRFAELAE